MNDLPDSRIAKLVARFEAIGAARMIHLPFYRQDLAVEAVGFVITSYSIHYTKLYDWRG